MRRPLLLSLLFLVLLCTILLSIVIGPAGTPFLDLDQEVTSTIVFSVRLPRAIAAALVGIGLAASGVVMQGLFRNSMADPYLLGTSSGGALGAAFAIVFLNGTLHWVFAFIGCIVAMAIVYAISVRGGRVPVEQLLLTGIAVSVFLSALLSFLMYTSDKSLHQIFLWLMGGFWSVSWSDVTIGLLVLPASLSLLLFSRELNIFSMGEEDALHLGVDTERMKKGLLLASAFVTGISVAIAGSIGFIGLITPHLMRLLLGPDHRFLLPGAMMAGGVLLVLSDTLARTIGGEVPVGVITAFFGAPFFIFLLKRRYAP
ncbi:MAG: iron chelate uptake ABC transporter family permease subunit [Methanomicrobiales archaeon]|nr:iron chelate uptake ABC transporter family permease subunit [Methanomicrobiales archaeon]